MRIFPSKLRIYLAGLFCLFFFFLSSIDSADAFMGNAKPVQESSIWKGKDVHVDLFSGDTSYTIPIEVPPGTNGLTPNLKLEYHSNSARGKSGFFGLGWSFNFSYILRDTHNTPSNSSDDTFTLIWDGSSFDLRDMGNDTFKTKNESFFSITLKRTSTENSKGAFWVVKASDGTSYRLGYRNDSELNCSNRDYVIGWGVDEVTDTNGNKIYYTYAKNPHPNDVGAIYPLKIEYNNDKSRTIEFSADILDNPHISETYFEGCRIKYARQLKTITTRVNGDQVKKYILIYDNTVSKSLLKGITELGSNNSAKNPASFQYFPQVSKINSSQVWANNLGVNTSTSYGDFGVTNPGRFVDVNGDGLVDIVRGGEPGYSSNQEWKVWLNTGTGWGSAQVWANNIGVDTRIAYGSFGVNNPGQLVDVNGDGLVDIARGGEPGLSSNQEWKVWLNTGTGWGSAQVWANNIGVDTRTSYGSYGTSNPGQLVDVNGDGLVDIVRGGEPGLSSNQEWKVWINKGDRWNSTPEIWANNIGVDTRTSYGSYGTNNPGQLVDVNGDGLVDIARGGEPGFSSSQEWRVWLNDGTKFSATSQVWGNNLGVTTSSSFGSFGVNNPGQLVDVNGDGLVDIVRGGEPGYSSNQEWKVWLNTGTGWGSAQVWANNLGVSTSTSYGDFGVTNPGQLVDVNGDGLVDIARGGEPGYSSNQEWRVWLNDGKTPDMLSKITNSIGGVTDLSYTPSTKFSNKGTDNISDLPMSLWIATSVKENNGVSGNQGTNETTTFSYLNGKYDFKSKEFRGFGQTTVTDANRTLISKFYQDDALKGKIFQEEKMDANGNPFTKMDYSWKNTTQNGLYITLLEQLTQSTFDGVVTNPKVKQEKFEYDEYGNITKIVEEGDVNTTGDEKTSIFEYVYNPTSWIVNKVKHFYVQGSNGNKVEENWIAYDGKAYGEAPTAGNITKEEKAINDIDKIQTTYTYDTYGNKKTVTDPNNNLTKYEYGITDTTFTYPEKITNAKNQVSVQKYDLATGNLLQTTDPNGFITKYTYDTFGRKEKEIKEYDSESYPTVQYTYLYDGSAPEMIKTSYRKTTGGNQVVDELNITDGFARTIQTKKDAGDSLQQIVENLYYDQAGKITKRSVQVFVTKADEYTIPQTSEKVTLTSYDALGRDKVITNPDGSKKEYTYDHWNKKIKDENGHIKTEYKNAYDLITKIDEQNNGEIYTTTYSYTPNGNLSLIKDAKGNEINFTYDYLGRKTTMSDPDLGNWEYGYDNVGNITSVKDNRNITIKTEFDPLNRVTKIDYPTDRDIIYTYDTDKIGTLAKIDDATGITEKTYDNKLRLTKEKKTLGTKIWINEFTYDASDKVIKQKYPDGSTVDFIYNNGGKLAKIDGVIDEINYNPQNKIQYIKYANGIATNLSYNPDSLRLQKIETSSNTQDLEYTYDNTGNITSIKDNLLDRLQTFTYDDINRVKEAKEIGGYQYNYLYNSVGNITAFNDGGNTVDFVYGQRPHAVISTNFPNLPPTPSVSPTSTATPTPTPTSQPSVPPTVVSSTSASVTTGALTLPKPTGTVNGDLLILTASADLDANENLTYTVASGWDILLPNTRSDAAGAGNNLQVWYKIASNEPANYTVTPDHNNLIGGSIVRIKGHNPDDPIDITAVTKSTTGEASAPSVATTINNDLVLRFVTWDQSKTLNALPSGHTKIYHVDVSGHDNFGGYKEQGTAGSTGVAQFDLSSGSPYVGYTLAIKPQNDSNMTTPTPTPLPSPTVTLTPTATPTLTPTPTSVPTLTPTPTAQTSQPPAVLSSTSGNVSTGWLTLVKPTGTMNGDLLILTASADLSASENLTYTVASGWNVLLSPTRSDATSAGNNLQVWYKIANAEPDNYTIMPDHNRLIGGSIIRITGHNSQNPIDVTAVTSSLTGEAAAPSVTTTVANDLILRLVTWDQSKSIVAIPAGHTQIYSVHVSGHDNWGGYKQQLLAGSTGIAQMDLSSSSPYVGFTVAIKP